MTVELETGTPPPNRVELSSATCDIAVVALIGEHDLGRYDTLAAILARATVRAPYVIVDLSECEFIDSTTVGLLLHTHTVTSRHRGGFAVVIAPEPGPVSRVAELVHLDQLMTVHSSLEAAIASFDSN
jgi:anti-anti-sigma factor